MPRRRPFLAACAGLSATIAGCVDAASNDGAGGAADGSPTGTPDADGSDGTRSATTAADTGGSGDGSSTTTGTPTATPSDAGLDLREANVTDVKATPDGDGYRFDVTLYHDDDGEDGYANWWQVESLDGARLGRRDLLHPHGTREFERSATVAVPAGTACVVVRGHDETHGYGGRAALVTLDGGATRFVDQGPEPRSFAGADCP